MNKVILDICLILATYICCLIGARVALKTDLEKAKRRDALNES